MPSTWFITGSSRGLGLELTEQLLARGDRVVATLRRPGTLAELAGRYPEQLFVRELDVTDANAVRRVVDNAFVELGPIDVVVSNAGYGIFGTAEDLSDQQVRDLVETNLVGSILLARAVVPHLRDQGGGTFVQLSSMGGHIAFPTFSMYHATKWGIEGFFEAFATEVEPFGIRTVLIEPGMVRTTFYEASTRVPVSAPYAGSVSDRSPMPVDQMLGDQTLVVEAIITVALSENPPRRLLLGSDAYDLVTTAIQARLERFQAQREQASQTDRRVVTDARS